jgi:epoxide hydrolase
VSDWSQGIPLEMTKALIERWRTHYNLRRFERQINAYSQFHLVSGYALICD